MGSKERIQRVKENTRNGILKAALKIVREQGWHALNMRKIAEKIDYTPPVIYEYFSNKESLVAELSNTGYKLLTLKIQKAKNKDLAPAEKLEAMWLAYWDFAFEEKELYQAMFGVEVHCPLAKDEFSRGEIVASLFSDVIRELINNDTVTDDIVCTKYFTFWSVVHGLVSINLIQKGTSDEINQRVLHEAINTTIKSIINN
jgi:AcrR family transcriptional regulator